MNKYKENKMNSVGVYKRDMNTKKYYLVFLTKIHTFTITAVESDKLCEYISYQTLKKKGRILINISDNFNNSIEYIKLYNKLIGG